MAFYLTSLVLQVYLESLIHMPMYTGNMLLGTKNK